MIALTTHRLGAVVPVLAQPGAKRDAVLGERDGALRLAVSAPPEKGKANSALRDMLAGVLGCKASQVTLLSGEAARRKTFLVAGVGLDELRARVDALVGPATAGRR